MIPAVLRFTAFPFFVFVLPAGGLVLLRGGAAPTAATLVPLVAGVALIALLERVIPYDPSWNRPRGDVGLDAIYLVFTLAVSSLTQATVTTAASSVAARIGLELWPASWATAIRSPWRS